MEDLAKATVRGLAEKLASGSITSKEICEGYLGRIDAHDADIHAFLKIDREAVLSAAAESDARRAAGHPLSPYDGIPVGIKDNICVKGETVSCASKILAPVKSPYDATAVSRLRSAGFIPFGRLNMDEFAMGSSCENSAFGGTKNPLDVTRVPGGSSGGSAAAVAAGFVPVALGSDTGGSIRQPASFCGISGLKPTYGRVSRNGLVAFASSLDQIGPLCRDVADAALILDIISGKDAMDCTCLPITPTSAADAIAKCDGVGGLRIGLPKEYLGSDVPEAVAGVVRNAAKSLEERGAKLVEVSLPHTSYAVAVYYIVATAEASANLARFDGIRYGDRKTGSDLVDTYFKTRGAGFGPEVKRRILLGTYVLSSGYYDAYYLKAQKVRTLIRRDFEQAFGECDVMLTPVTPSVAFKFGEKKDPLEMYLSDIFTIALNLSGHCGISVPGGTDPATGMPVGIQFMAPDLAEDRLLSTASFFQRNVFNYEASPGF